MKPYLEKLRDHRDRGDVNEASGGEEENERRHASKLAAEQPDKGAKHGTDRRRQLQKDRLALGAAGLNEDRKVADLVRHLGCDLSTRAVSWCLGGGKPEKKLLRNKS